MKKNLKVRMCAVITAVAACMMPASVGSVSAYSVTDLQTQIEELVANSSIYTYTPILPQTDRFIASSDWDLYAGVLVYCEDTANLEGSFCGERYITMLPYDEHVKDCYPEEWEGQIIMHLDPFEEKVACWNNVYTTGVLHTTVDVSGVPAEYAGKEEHFYVTDVAPCGVPNEEWCRDLLEDERFTVVGLLNAHHRQLGEYISPPAFRITAEEGCSLDWAAISEEYFGIEYNSEYDDTLPEGVRDFWLKEEMPQAEAVAICQRLEERTDIASATLNASFLDSVENFGTIGIQVISLKHYGTGIFGDANQDGDLNVKDAQAALSAAGDIRLGLTPQISAEGIAVADVDGDGTLTVKDAQYILMYYANTRAEIDCSWQSLTGNPNAPAQSNLA